MQIAPADISPVNTEARKSLGIKPGDTVRVYIKVQEKGKIRLQPYEGLVLSTKHGTEPGAMFTVRRVASGVGMEKIFPLYSPNIDKIEIIRRAKVRRAKLYYIREKAARQVRRQLRNMQLVNLTSGSDIAEKEERERSEAEEVEKEEVKNTEQTDTPEVTEEKNTEQTEEKKEEKNGEKDKEGETDSPNEVANEAEQPSERADSSKEAGTEEKKS